MKKLKPASIALTEDQIKWIKEKQQTTGMQQAEIVRRALDHYIEAEESKARRRIFTPEQRQNLKEIARRKGVSEAEVIRDAVQREVRFMQKLYEKKNNL